MTAMTQVEEIKAAVLALPREERAEIVGAAMESLVAPGPLSDAWKTELDRREAEYEQGKAELIDHDEVFARVADLKHVALDLEQNEREELVEALLYSLDRTEEIDHAWMEEAHRRYEAFRAGKIRALDHDEVVARFQARFG
jgi:putative addiction module component (TIGR02574 family)